MATNVGNLQATLGLNSAGFTAGMKGAETRVQKFSKNSVAALKKVAKVGAIALAATAALSVKAASDFESSFAGVRKTVDATEKEFKSFEKQLRTLAKTIPINVNELNRIAEAAGQLGIEKKNIIGFTETMAKLGVTTNLTSEEAATGMARFANITQLPQEQIANLGSVLVDLGNNLATTEKEILDMGLRLAGAGVQIGLTEEQTLGLAGALSSVGIRAESGGTAFSRVMADMASAAATGGDAMAGFAEVAGQSATDFTKSFQETPAQAINDFIKGLARIKTEGGNTFGVLDELDLGSIRVRDALLRTAGAGDLVADSIKLAGEAFEENTALTEEAEKRFETFESQMIIFKNLLQDVAITIGSVLLPVLINMVEFITPIVTKFGELAEKVKAAIEREGGVIPALTKMVTKTSSSQESISGSIKKINKSIKTLKPVVKDVSSFYVKEMTKIAKFFEENRPLIQRTSNKMASIIKGALNQILTVFNRVWPVVSSILKSAWETMKVLVSSAVDKILSDIKVAMQLFTGDWVGAWETVKESLRTQIENIKTLANTLVEGMKEVGKNILRGLVEGLVSVKDSVKSQILGILKAVLPDAVEKMLGISSPSKVFKQIGVNTLQGLVDGLRDNLPALKAQLDQVEETLKAFQQRAQNIGDQIGQMLGTLFGKQKTKTELKIEAEDVARREAAFAEREAGARAAIADPETSRVDVARAKEELKQIAFERQRIVDEKQAAIEREQLQNRQTEAMAQFETVVSQIESGQITRAAGETRINEILGSVGLTFKEVQRLTQEVDSDFNKKLRTAITEIGLTATRIRELVVKQLESKTAVLTAQRLLNIAKINLRVQKAAEATAKATETLAKAERAAARRREKGLPALAGGGIITRPTAALVGEAGPEAVIPLSKLGEFNGGPNFDGATFMLNIPDGKVDTFTNELATLTRNANLKGRVING